MTDARDYSPTIPGSDLTWSEWEKHHSVLHSKLRNRQLEKAKELIYRWFKRSLVGLISIDYITRFIIYLKT